MNRFIITNVLCAAASLCGAGNIVLAEEAEQEGLHIDAQQLSSALREFSEQTGLQIGYAAELAEGKETAGVAGVDDPEVALDTLLARSGLEHRFVNAETVVIRAAATSLAETEVSSDSGNSRATLRPVLLAQAQASVEPNQPSQRTETDSDKDEKDRHLEEIVVIGSHIRNARAASPVYEFDKSDIARTGAITLDQFFETIPQNFGGGASEARNVGSMESSRNFGRGTSINLRGLGSDSTLVLVNGRRLAPAGIHGSFVDTSLIPMQAIERVEVLTDGASALYGADAIAGVVNIVMQNSYEGADTAIRVGSVTDGDLKELRLAQSLGGNWDDGYAFLSYQYYRRDSLGAEDRDFTEVTLPRTLLPQQVLHSVYGGIGHNPSDNLSLFVDVLYSDRKSEGSTVSINFVGGLADFESGNEQLAASFGAQYDVNDNWRTRFSAGYTEYDLDSAILTLNPGIDTRFNMVATDVWSVDALVDGSLAHLPGGKLGLALGASYREEVLERLDLVGAAIRTETFPPRRQVKAAFAELFVPLVGPDNRKTGIQALEFSLAARYEDYSDFGNEVTPKYGLRWEPVAGISLRGTWGESFRAPLLHETEQSDFLVAVEFTGFPYSLQRDDTGPLEAEISTQWTAGFDLQPEWAPFSLSFNYFDIEYEGRIARPVFNLFEFITNPERFSSDILVQNPSVEFQDSIIAIVPAENQFLDIFRPYEPEAIEWYMDWRVTNIAVERQNGYDLSIDYPLETALGQFRLSLSGSYIKTFEKAATPQGVVSDVRNILFGPIDLRLRAGVFWEISDAWSTALFINYRDDYKQFAAPAEQVKIDSWTTADLNVRYDLTDRAVGSFLNGTTLSLNIRNLLDEDPPFVLNEGANGNVGYDGANASPLGRFVSLDFRKQW